MSEKDFAEFLREAAAGYNEPPEPPREEMWAEIEERRERGPVIGRIPGARWARWGAGVAAALLVGFGLGRLSRPAPAPELLATAASPAPPTSPTERPRAERRDAAAARTAARVDTVLVTRTDTVRITRLAGADRALGRPVSRLPTDALLGVPAGQTATLGGTRSGLPPGGSAAPAYRRAAARHLNEAAALVTAVQSGPPALRRRAVSRWASDLLSTTRLLLDSPAARQPAMRAVLSDLELLLAQVARTSPEGGTGESEWTFVRRGLDRHDMLPRLRMAARTASYAPEL